ncbi:MAG: GNAT family N-acetyltransferase [Chloroflexota bacterium]|nr:GNAT family N-acetyltransferase [Chloroflexota bacterium]
MLMKAQATTCQAKRFAQLAQMAGDNVFTEFFGNRANAVLEAMYLQADNYNSHSHTTFLQEDAAVAGMIHAYTAAAARDQAPRTNWLYLKYARLQIFRVLATAILLRDILGFQGEHLSEEDYYIVYLAIYPQYRGRGHSQTLLNHASYLARQAGCSRLALDVDERNTIARAAYQRAGFVQIGQSKKVHIENERWGILRLAKPIAPG